MQKRTPTMQHQKLAYSVKELSKLAGVCERKIHYEIKEGKLKTSRIGRRILILATEVERWLEEAEVI
ncbi:MAG TPA: helix-turn-helix domain-containing protein [Pyrinomonadaceae bacterium]|jgi:excisionase family DNA binding protein